MAIKAAEAWPAGIETVGGTTSSFVSLLANATTRTFERLPFRSISAVRPGLAVSSLTLASGSVTVRVGGTKVRSAAHVVLLVSTDSTTSAALSTTMLNRTSPARPVAGNETVCVRAKPAPTASVFVKKKRPSKTAGLLAGSSAA